MRSILGCCSIRVRPGGVGRLQVQRDQNRGRQSAEKKTGGNQTDRR